MRCLTHIIALAFVTPAHSVDSAQESTDGLVNKLVNKLVYKLSDRALEALPLYHADMDDVTLGKPAHSGVPTSGRPAHLAMPISQVPQFSFPPASPHLVPMSAPACRLAPLHSFSPQFSPGFSPEFALGTKPSSRSGGSSSYVRPASSGGSGSVGGHAVIMQNKGGGHGEIGYHLAMALQSKGLTVTLLQDSAAKETLVPYSLYEDKLPNVRKIWMDPSNPGSYSGATQQLQGVTHIFDNYSKDPKQISPLLDLAKASPNFKLYSFISSAGMYTAKGELVENGAVKDPPTGQRGVEMALERELPGKWASFRPQYIYGPYTNKRDYLDWFLARGAQGLPMGVPGDGSQPVNVAHCEDVGLLLSSVVGNEAAAGGEIFNCGTADQVTYRALCEAAGDAFGKNANIVSLPAGTKTSFPFRPNAEGFYVNVNKAQQKLGWPGPRYNVLQDISREGFYTKGFKMKNLDSRPVDTSKDGLSGGTSGGGFAAPAPAPAAAGGWDSW